MQHDNSKIQTEDLKPRPQVTVFDWLQFSLPLSGGSGTGLAVGQTFGIVWGFITFTIAGLIFFFIFRWVIRAFVVFIHRHCSAQSSVGYAAACYVLSHFNERT
jgi:hypothetical protein